MNMLKLLKNQQKTSAKAVALREQLAQGVITQIDSAHAMVRVVHANAHRTWTKKEETLAIQVFRDILKARGTKYQLLNDEARLEVLRKTAQKVGRSTEAVRLRLTNLGLNLGRRIK